jgi:hypothetical protein
LPEAVPKDAFRDNLSSIPVISNAEVFFYLNERLRRKDSYFYCGTDLFAINDREAHGPGPQQTPDQLRAANQKAVEWLFKEELLKADYAHPSMFVAEVLKRFIWTSEQQAIFLCGETGSGKTSNLPLIVQAVTHYNLSNFNREKVESLKAHNNSVMKRVSRLEEYILNNEEETLKKAGSILPSQGNELRKSSGNVQSRKPSHRSSAVPRPSRAQSPTIRASQARPSRVSINSAAKEEVYAIFNQELEKALQIAHLFVQIYHGDGSFSNGGSLKIVLNADNSAKFVGFSLSVSALQSFKVTTKVP